MENGGKHFIRISIHAPAKGATKTSGLLSQDTLNFNPRSREGSDFIPPFNCISKSLFQSTLPRRERLRSWTPCLHHLDFNPRSREGSDWFPLLVGMFHFNFNPRSREGSDLTYPPVLRIVGISIHAPAKGATNKKLTMAEFDVFQSTLPRRERRFI